MSSQTLGAADAHAVLELIDQIATTATVDEYARVTMEGLYGLIPCVDTSYNEMVPSEGRIEWTAYPEKAEMMGEFAPLFGQLMRQNPLVSHFEDTGDTRAMMWSDFTTLDQLQGTPLFEEMFRPLGISSQMAVTLPAPPGIVVGFAVNRGDGDFDERDRAVLNTLRPHLAHAYRSIQLRDELSVTRSVLRARGWTGALADGDGIIEAVTENAQTLESESGVELSAGEPLPERLRTPFLDGVTSYRASQPAVLSRAIRLSHEADGVAAWHVPGPVAPHVVIVQMGVDAAAQRLGEAGLTKRQVEVALHLAEGGTNPVIAKRLGIAEGTLRKHLERIYRALGVTDRATAIARIRGW
jgi:DNA-binding CsgD family transcriptional regulator